jgi:hypothetical protein
MKRIFKIPENYDVTKYLNCNESYIRETFNKLVTIDGIDIYDTDHAVLRFKERFPSLNLDRLYTVLEKGMRKIFKTWNYDENFYVIESHKYHIKVPLEIRPDRKNPQIIMGFVATVLDSIENPYNKNNEIQIMVESSKKDKIFQQFSEFDKSEGDVSNWYQHYIDEGKYWTDFQYIEVD